jgi:hypothetical protein
MKSLMVVLLLALASTDGQSGTAQQSQPDDSSRWKVERKTKDSQGCIFVSDAGNLYDTWWGNTCPQAMQFTIQWSGNGPAQNVTYRVNGRPSVRHVARADVNAVLISEAPAAVGIGPKVDYVEIEKKDLGLGQTQIFLHDAGDMPVFVGGFISIQKEGKEVRRCELGMEIESLERLPACVYFSGEGFTPNFTAERETQ